MSRLATTTVATTPPDFVIGLVEAMDSRIVDLDAAQAVARGDRGGDPVDDVVTDVLGMPELPD